jgi:hypothetical protein
MPLHCHISPWVLLFGASRVGLCRLLSSAFQVVHVVWVLLL